MWWRQGSITKTPPTDATLIAMMTSSTSKRALDHIEQQLTAVRRRQAADYSEYPNTSDRNEHRRLLTEKLLIENGIPYSAFSSGVVRIPIARGELAKLSLETGNICFTSNNWLNCGRDHLLRICKGPYQPAY